MFKIKLTQCLGIAMILFSLISVQIQAVTSTEVFSFHQKRVFVESGSYLGDGIQKALDAGFEEIHSVELAPHLYDHCCKRFSVNPNVHLYLGDSSIVFKTILEHIDEPVTFWLDGHYSACGTAKGNTYTPLLNELAAIAGHHIKTHTILIDDVRMFSTVEFDYISQATVLQLLFKINPKYKFYYRDGYQKNDVLVAEIK